MAARDLTSGGIVKGVALFALPLLGTSVVQQLYSTVDVLFVGNVLGTASMAALGVGSLLITLIIGLFTGLSAGLNVKVANLMGAGDVEGLRVALRTTLGLGIASGTILAVVGELFAAPFIDAMDVPPESYSLSLAYLRYAVAAALPIGVYNLCAGALRGLGDSASPLIAQGIGGAGNIVANWVALCVFSAGIEGCAQATFVSNSVAAALAAIALVRSNAYGQMGSKIPAIEAGVTRWAMAFGAPVALQTVAIVLSNVAVQHQVDLIGVDAVAAFTAYLKVELPIYFVILAIGQTATTFVAQNYGAGDEGRCRKGARLCQNICLVLAAGLSLVMLAVLPQAFGLFDRSENVIAIGTAFAQITFPFYFVYAVLEVQADVIRGYGRSLGPALIVLANICVLRVVIVYTATAQGMGMDAIAISYPITWATTAVCLVILCLILARRATSRIK